MHLRYQVATLAITAFLFLLPLQVWAEAPSGEFKVSQVIPLGGEGGWDYLTVDSKARRVFISRGTHVMVVDAISGALLGDIPNTPGVHGIAVVPGLNRAYITKGNVDEVAIVDLKDFHVIGNTKTGANPDAILYDPASKRVFSFNGRGNNVTAIEAKEGTVAGTIALNGKPEFAVADGKGQLFVNLENTAEIVVIDSKKLEPIRRIPLAPCESPTGLALDGRHRRLFTVCRSKVMGVVDPDHSRVVSTLPIGEGTDAAAFDPELQLAFSSNGRSGDLTIVHEDSPAQFKVVQTLSTALGARTMALDAATHTLYLVTADMQPPPTDQTRGRPVPVPGTFRLLIVKQ